MTRVEYNKLIRDNIKDKIESSGDSCEIKILKDSDFREALLGKLVEEARELKETKTREDFLSEYADLIVVLDELTNLDDFSEADIRLAIEESLKKKGRFKKRHFLLWSEYKK